PLFCEVTDGSRVSNCGCTDCRDWIRRGARCASRGRSRPSEPDARQEQRHQRGHSIRKETHTLFVDATDLTGNTATREVHFAIARNAPPVADPQFVNTPED